MKEEKQNNLKLKIFKIEKGVVSSFVFMMVNGLEWLYLSITHYQVHDAQGREREGKADKKSILYIHFLEGG